MKSGIYMIQNVITGDRYIGSSRNLKHRRACHFSEMRNGDHGNYKIKRDCKKYGEEAFRWFVLEYVEENRLVEREQHWLDTAKPEYNIKVSACNFSPHMDKETMRIANQKRSQKMTGRKQSSQERRSRSESFRRRWADPVWRDEYKKKLAKTPEQKEVLRQLATGVNNGNYGKKRPKEFSKLISDLFSSIEYTYINPSGEEVVFRNLIQFCKDNNLSYVTMRSMHQGRRKSPYNGWTFKSKTFVGYKKER